MVVMDGRRPSAVGICFTSKCMHDLMYFNTCCGPSHARHFASVAPSLPFCSWRELFSDLVGKQHGGQEGHHHQAGCSTCARRQPGQVHPVPLPGYKHFQVGSWLCCGSALNSCGSGSKNLLTRIRILPLPNNRYVRCRYVFVMSLITLTFLDKKNPNFCLKIVQSR